MYLVQHPHVACISNSPRDLQALLDIVVNYSTEHGYQLQPNKSVILHTAVKQGLLRMEVPFPYSMLDAPIATSEEATHLGVIHNKNLKLSASSTIQKNINKWRRTLYSLMRTV